jgi:hypothetical protein
MVQPTNGYVVPRQKPQKFSEGGFVELVAREGFHLSAG